ncbi:MDR family oxidoreductase [Bradyrhizobium diazoefficiens]|uniref:acrylyl-CoA reductase (NADPH) n=1 Tax=Bradyrhizobium diazoefficiens TaxID=1355477 RepID=UPI000576A6D1|nr:MDR family oxidoreductase [Bradyrhizobium diazoefficiens]
MPFKALLARQSESGAITARVEQLDDSDLMSGDVTVAIEWSTVNYKDGLALTGAAPVIRTFPLIPGIDFAGTVEASSDLRFAVGDKVVLNGWGLSQTHHGGYAQRARVKGDWLVKLPARIGTRDAMAIGTAGYTAMLSVLALEQGGITPQRGSILVTGASGGVGSIAIAILARLGYRVIASTGRSGEEPYLKNLGAAEIIDRATLSGEGSPLGPERWAGAVDSVGSRTLVNVLAQTSYGGVVTSCGLAQGVDLPGTVRPFILRAVTLAGIDSVNAPNALREKAWIRLAADLDFSKLASTTTEIGLADVPAVATSILKGQVRGRTVVDVNN